MPTTDIPHDIWLHIAQFIPLLVLRNMFSLNRTFFDIAMDLRYQQVSFAYLNQRMIRTLVRLKDPAVAKRVRVLHIHPYFVKQVLEKETTLPAWRSKSLRRKLDDIACRFRDLKLFGKNDEFRLIRSLKTSDDVVEVMLDILSGLQNITDYHIMWYGLPTIHQSPTSFLIAAFRPNLRKLSMEVSLENLEKLVSVTGVLDNLEELDLFFRVDSSHNPVNHTAIMVNHLAPFINHLHPTLQYFAIQSWEPLDFCPLFQSLRFFPALKKISIAIPNSRPHLGDPAGLQDLLTRQSETLQHLTLRCTQFSGAGLIADENPVHEWMKQALCDVTIANLQTLEVGLGLFPIETAIMCLQRFAKTLLSLVMTGRYLTYEQIGMAVSTFAHYHADVGLKSLRLGPLTLSPQLVDLLAEKLPGLGRLELLIREVVPQEGDLPVYYIAPNPDHNQDEDQIEMYFTEMEKRFYPSWRLRHIALSRSSFPYTLQYELQHIQLFAECVPTIQYVT